MALAPFTGRVHDTVGIAKHLQEYPLCHNGRSIMTQGRHLAQMVLGPCIIFQAMTGAAWSATGLHLLQLMAVQSNFDIPNEQLIVRAEADEVLAPVLGLQLLDN